MRPLRRAYRSTAINHAVLLDALSRSRPSGEKIMTPRQPLRITSSTVDDDVLALRHLSMRR
jgi:hypothetical protein